MKKRLISIIVPAYNAQNTIKNTLYSILNQTYNLIEIIVVDDGSADKTVEVVKQIQDGKKNIILIQQKNCGVTNARLNGVRHANGEWIGFVDSDDVVEPNMYEKLINNAITNNVQISHCGYKLLSSDGRLINKFYDTGCCEKHTKEDGLRELLSGLRIEPSLGNKLFHIALFHSLLHDKLMDESIKVNEDLLMNYYLFKEAESSFYEDFCPYHAIAYPSSTSRRRNGIEKMQDTLKVWDIIANDSNGILCDVIVKGYISRHIAAFGCFSRNIDDEIYMWDIRNKLLATKPYWKNIGRNQRIRAKLIEKTPRLYKYLDALYSSFFQKRKYE